MPQKPLYRQRERRRIEGLAPRLQAFAHQLGHAMPDHRPCMVKTHRRMAALGQQGVQCVGKIGRAVDQRAVQIEDDGAPFTHGSRHPSPARANDQNVTGRGQGLTRGANGAADQRHNQLCSLDLRQMAHAGQPVQGGLRRYCCGDFSGGHDRIVTPDNDSAGTGI